jgi:hypothetical protein
MKRNQSDLCECGAREENFDSFGQDWHEWRHTHCICCANPLRVPILLDGDAPLPPGIRHSYYCLKCASKQVGKKLLKKDLVKSLGGIYTIKKGA